MKAVVRALCVATAFLLPKAVLALSTEEKIERLEQQSQQLQHELKALKAEHKKAIPHHVHHKHLKKAVGHKAHPNYKSVPLSVHVPVYEPDLIAFQPKAVMAGNYILTYIAGMPVVTSPYLGSRPAFDGSDLIINISSINQDVRLMMQRNAIFKGLNRLGYPLPQSPIIAVSGKAEPYAIATKSFTRRSRWDMDLGSAQLDVAAALNSWVEGYLSIAFDPSAPGNGGRRINNSALRLSKGFLNVGNLAESPFYFTAGQLYVPFGRYSSSMVSAPLPLIMARTMSRTVIVGYRHQKGQGLFAALFGFNSDTTVGGNLSGGVNVGYDFDYHNKRGEIGFSLISGINDAVGMQGTGLGGGQFGGFGVSSAAEAVKKVPAIDLHANVNIDALNFSAEWVSTLNAFRQADLSANTRGARPQSMNLEAAYTFKLKDKPASFGVGYGWSRDALALNLPKHRLSGVFNISIWRDTVQSLEFRHDIDYGRSQTASGISATGGAAAITRGTGRSANTVTAQFGIYF